MELNDSEKILCNEACQFINSKKEELIDKFIIKKNPLKLGFITIFMAGSPGAGKTEFSKRYMPLVIDKKDEKLVKFLTQKGVNIASVETLFVRIDVDEIREFLPQYQKTNIENLTKGNAHVVQKAANKGLDVLRDYCLSNEISFLHDGTFCNHSTMKEIIKKSISAGREVQIYYIYLDPLVAWEFTKAREYFEGRNIIKEKFIEQYFHSRENVDKIKQEFGDKVKIHCILKNKENKVEEIVLNQPSIDLYLQSKYNSNVIRRYSPEELSDLLS
jgi:predicted ABC-type ATPase